MSTFAVLPHGTKSFDRLCQLIKSLLLVDHVIEYRLVESIGRLVKSRGRLCSLLRCAVNCGQESAKHECKHYCYHPEPAEL